MTTTESLAGAGAGPARLQPDRATAAGWSRCR
jgi:hypothetical protein